MLNYTLRMFEKTHIHCFKGWYSHSCDVTFLYHSGRLNKIVSISYNGDSRYLKCNQGRSYGRNYVTALFVLGFIHCLFLKSIKNFKP